jgi:protein TonB
VSAHSFSPFPPLGAPGAAIGRLRGQFTPFALIVAVHALVLYGVYSGLLHRVVQSAMPAEVFVSFVAEPTPPPPPVTQATPPAEVAILAPPSITVPTTVIAIAPAEPAASVAAPVAAEAGQASPAVGAAAAAPPPAPPAEPRTVASVEYLKPPQPDYPVLSRRMGEQGKVVLRVLVGANGLPEQVLVQSSSGFQRLDEAGRQAALRAQFKPNFEDGRPVAVYVTIPLNFQLGR